MGEGQSLYGFTHTGNIRNSERERKENEWEKLERVTKHERLLTLGNKQGVVKGEVGREMG